MAATRSPPVPNTPAVVLQALTSIPDPAFAYRLRVRIDGKPVDGVPWGWSVHPLPLGEHTLELFHRSGSFPRASRATVDVTLHEATPVMHVVYSATTLGIRPGRVSVAPYVSVGAARSDEHGAASPALHAQRPDQASATSASPHGGVPEGELTDDKIVEHYLEWCLAKDAQECDTAPAKAWEAMTNLPDDDPERAWTLLLRVIALADPEDGTLCSAGADCLENLFRTHGARFIDRIEDRARQDPKFRQALACVWADEEPLRPRLDQLLADLGQPRL